MRNYKKQLELKLSENNWVIIEINASDYWWDDEH